MNDDIIKRRDAILEEHDTTTPTGRAVLIANWRKWRDDFVQNVLTPALIDAGRALMQSTVATLPEQKARLLAVAEAQARDAAFMQAHLTREYDRLNALMDGWNKSDGATESPHTRAFVGFEKLSARALKDADALKLLEQIAAMASGDGEE